MFGSELPRWVLGGLAARVAPVLAESSAQDAKHTSAARRTHHRPRPAPDGEPSDSEGSRPQSGRPEGARQWPSNADQRSHWGQLSRKPHRARGWKSQSRPLEERERTNQRRRWESPKPPLGEGKARTNAAQWKSQSRPLEGRERTNQRRRAKGRRTSWAKWGLLSHDGLWRGWKSSFSLAFETRLRAPKVRFHFAFLSPPPLNRHFTTSQPPPPLARFQSRFLSRFSTHDPTLRRLLTRFLTSFLNPFALPMARSARGRSSAGSLNQSSNRL